MSFKCTINDVTDDMPKATETNVYWWAFCHIKKELVNFEVGLGKAEKVGSEDLADWYKYNIIRCKKILTEIYAHLLTLTNFNIDKPEWLDEFLGKTED